MSLPTTGPTRDIAARGAAGGRRRIKGGLWLAAALYLVYALIYTWPLALHPLSTIPAPGGLDNPNLSLWTLAWDLGAIGRSPMGLLTGRVFDANIFFPAPHALAYTDHLLLQAVLAWPVYAATGSIAACYNAVLVFSLVAGALAMFAFARAITGSDAGALVAGLCWGFWPYHTAHLGSLPQQGLFLLPLAFLCLHRLIAGRRLRDALLLGVVAGAQAISSFSCLVVGGVGLTVGALGLLVSVGRWRSTAVLTRLALALLVSGVIAAPMVWPYLQIHSRSAGTPASDRPAPQPAHLASYLTVTSSNAIYGATRILRTGAAGESDPDQVLFVGFVVAALAAAGIWRSGRHRFKAVVWPLGAIVAAGFVLSLGLGAEQRVASAFGDDLFGSQVAGSPARFGVLVAFGLAGLAALGIDRLSPRGGLWLVALAAAGLEYVNLPIAVAASPSGRSETAAWLAAAPAPGPVIYLPLAFDARNASFMLESLQHRRPILNGYGWGSPDSYPELCEALRGFPGNESLWALRRLEVRYVVSTHAIATPPSGPLIERASFGDVRIYELSWTVSARAALVPPELPPAPRSPEVSLPDTEVASYELAWASSGVNLPAGDAKITLGPGGAGAPPGAAHRLEAMFTTAAWVSRYFQAQDHFTTWTDAGFMPLLHVEHLQEGNRTVQLKARFDSSTHQVRILRGPEDSGAAEEVSPLPAGTRDPLGALFYARTRVIAPRGRLRMSVNHVGSGMHVDLLARNLEEIRVGDRRQTALPVEVLITYDAEAREAPRATIWLSQDDRRIPLVIEIGTEFGSFRLTLTEYQSGPAKAR